MASNRIPFLSGIVNPSPSLVRNLESFERQLNLGFANAGGEETFGTLTASRRSSKPFIIGFIPPDNDINFVPVSRVDTKLGDVAGASTQGVKKVDLGNIDPNSFLGPPKGQVAQTIQRVAPGEIRQALIDSYVTLTGKLPSDAQLRLLFAQTALENGWRGGDNNFGTKNFQLSSIHAGNEPSWFIGTDHKSDGTPYEVAFVSFSSLQESSDHHMASLAKKWPNALSAETSADFNNAVLPSKGIGQPKKLGKDFHVDVEYQNKLDIQSGTYNEKFGSQSIESPLLAAPVTDVPENPRAIMKSGFIDDGVYSDRIGRTAQLASPERQKVARDQTDALRRQIAALQAIPPLILLINPSKFERSYEASSDTSVKGRYGHIVHNWLERPFSISSSGVTAGQYVVDAEGSGGLTNFFRVHSLSYENLLSLLLMYKNNGRVFAGSESDRGITVLAFTVFIYYDNHVYLGSFDSFSIDDEADRPYNMSYDFKFSVRYDRDVNPPVNDALISRGLRF